MKKYFFTTLLIFILGLSCSFAQYEIRHLPYFLDKEWQNKPADYVRNYNNKLYRSTPMPAYAQKFPKAPPRIQSQSGIELINISNAGSHQSENYIAVNPRNPNNIIVGSNDYRYNSQDQGYRMVAFYSNDGGKTWAQSNTPRINDIGLINIPSGSEGGCTSVDPGIGFDSEGNAYYIYLTAQLLDVGNGDNGVFVCKSTDGGKTWPLDITGVPVLLYDEPLQDKCFIGVDSDPSSPFANRVYAAWFDTKSPGGIGFTYSEDGLSFNSASTIKGSAAKSIQSPLPVVGLNGELYVCWEEKTEGGAKTSAVLQKSTDGGVSWVWGSPKTAQIVNTSGEIVGFRRALPDKADMRISSHPSMDIDLRNGNLYLVQAGKDVNMKYGVFLTKSTDGGVTWSAGSSIENLKKVDANSSGNDVFLSSISVDPMTGMIAILYYSSENDPQNNKGCDAFVAISFDEGKTFNHIQLTDTWYFNSSSVISAGGDNLGRYWGDYTCIEAYNGKIYPCFWMPTTQSADFWACDLFTANLSTAPEPPTELSYENLWQEPTKVTLLWKDPEKNKLSGPIGDFKIHIYKDGNKIAEVDKGVGKYVDNSAIEGQTFTYRLKVFVSSTGEESVFADISGISGGAIEPKPPTAIMPHPVENGILLSWTNPTSHIDDTYAYDISKVEIYVDNQLVKTVSAPEIQAGNVSSVLIEQPIKKFYSLKLKAKTLRGTTVGESQFSENIIAYSGSPISELAENFDNSENMIPLYMTGTWGLTNEASSSAPNSLTDSPGSNYSGSIDTYVIFAPTVIESGKATLQIKHIGLINRKDMGIIKVTKDFGNNWDAISWVDIDKSVLWDKTGFTLAESQWYEQGFNLSNYIGDTVFFKFEFTTDQFNHKDGWYIDDVRVGNYPVGIKETSNITERLSAVLSPNPSENESLLNFYLPVQTNVDISLYDGLGRAIKNINNSIMNPGQQNIVITTSELTSGIYYVRIGVDGSSVVVPLIVHK